MLEPTRSLPSPLVVARDARSARAVTETAEAVAGWRAALLRGEVRAGRASLMPPWRSLKRPFPPVTRWPWSRSTSREQVSREPGNPNGARRASLPSKCRNGPRSCAWQSSSPRTALRQGDVDALRVDRGVTPDRPARGSAAAAPKRRVATMRRMIRCGWCWLLRRWRPGSHRSPRTGRQGRQRLGTA